MYGYNPYEKFAKEIASTMSKLCLKFIFFTIKLLHANAHNPLLWRWSWSLCVCTFIAGQILNHAVLGQASRRQFTSCECPFFASIWQLTLLESAGERFFHEKICVGPEDRCGNPCLQSGHATVQSWNKVKHMSRTIVPKNILCCALLLTDIFLIQIAKLRLNWKKYYRCSVMYMFKQLQWSQWMVE